MSDAIAAWFNANQRDLPWRRERSTYTALVAEAMLQQTQVSRIAERFGPFIARFPSIEDLAAAREQDVLAQWQGLGYYRRAQNLHRAAGVVVREFDGRMPSSASDLFRLPGVGRYTAGAIASIVHGERAPIVDGNVARVFCRLFDVAGPVDRTDVQAWLWSLAAALVRSAADPAAFNEGVMELGALICTPRAPRCEACPLRRSCAARRSGRQEEVPSPKRPPPRTSVHHHAVIIQREGAVLLVQRPARGLWARMWQAPTVESPRELRPAAVRAALGLPVGRLRRREGFTHQTTHRLVRFHVFLGQSACDRGVWRRPEATGDLPISSPHRRILAIFG